MHLTESPGFVARGQRERERKEGKGREGERSEASGTDAWLHSHQSRPVGSSTLHSHRGTRSEDL